MAASPPGMRRVRLRVCQDVGTAPCLNGTVKRMERVRLYPTRRQAAALDRMLVVCCSLYNAALQQRRDARKRRGVSVSHRAQYAELTALRRADPRVAAVYRECLDAALHRLDLAFQAFFRRCSRGEAPGYPRYRAKRRWNTLEFPHGDRALKFDERQNRVRVPGVGRVKLRKGRGVPPYGRAMIVRSCGHWYAQFECEREVRPLPVSGKVVGLDRGIAAYVATSDGELIENARIERHQASAVRRKQRAIARGRRGSQRQGRRYHELARAKDRQRWSRRDWHHKLSRRLVDAYEGIALEALTVRAMLRSARGSLKEPGRNVAAKAGLNRSIADAGWSQFASMIVSKAEEAARTVVFVDPKYSSQECSRCGHVASENRRTQAAFCCVACGHAENADINAAKVILKRAELRPAARGLALGRLRRPAKCAIAGENPAHAIGCCVRAHPTNRSLARRSRAAHSG
ncbi:MAG: transposase [Microbacteriaceae bacterium]|nr:MAG: transposase [Microbacteriaceae bacterium]